MIAFTLLFIILKAWKKYDIKHFKNQLIIVAIVIIYSLHPTITRLLFGLYYCIEIDTNSYWLLNDLQVECWTGAHKLWIIVLGVPAVLIWVIGAPFLMFILLWRKRLYIQN